MGLMKNWSSDALSRLSNDLQPLRSPTLSPPLVLATNPPIVMPVKSKIAKRPSAKTAQSGNPGAKKAVLKKPSASQSGNPGDAEGWGAFRIVPYTDQNNGETKGLTHLKLEGEMKKAPAVCKHIQGGTLHTSTGCQSVKDFLKSLEKKGDGSWLAEWEGANHAHKKAIMERLKLQLDEKSVLTIKQKTSAGTRTEHKQVRGWMSLWEVADVEKIPFDPKYSTLLQDCVADDESKAHPNPQLAKKGWRVYYHVKKKATTETLYHDEGHEADAEMKADDQQDFEAARKAITQAGLGKIAGPSARMTAQSGNPGAITTKASEWKAKADDMIKQLSDAEVAATSLQAEINSAIDNESNPALQRKHANLAGSWAKKLGLKKGFVLKYKTIASTSREDVFDKEGNKFDECLKQATTLKEEWEGENNQTLLNKLMEF